MKNFWPRLKNALKCNESPRIMVREVRVNNRALSEPREVEQALSNLDRLVKDGSYTVKVEK